MNLIARLKELVAEERKITYQDPVTGRKCESSHFLELDHLLAIALGGKTHADNLRLLCRSHNQLKASQAGLGWRAASRGSV